ncbi:MAG: RDD family protein [Actinomycetota bacterium]|nr:RDD family protein [Actinomycetota bacterium]
MTEEAQEEKSRFGRAIAGASDRVFDIVDPDLLLEHVDVNALLDRVDVNALLDRVDVDALLERADIDALMERVDIQAIVDRAGIPDIVAQSTGHLGGSALDLFRRPLVGLDEIIFRVLNGVARREPDTFPAGPSDLVAWVDDRREGEDIDGLKTGRYAGPLTRLLAVLLDSVFVTFMFTLFAGGITLMVQFFVPDFEFPRSRGLWYGVAYFLWAVVYMWVAVAIFGKTLGKMVLGVRVVKADGSVVVKGRSAFIRALTYPLSFALFGIGLLGAVFGRERRTWHDRFAGTAVVYDWGSRTAAMPTPLAKFLERRGADL